MQVGKGRGTLITQQPTPSRLIRKLKVIVDKKSSEVSEVGENNHSHSESFSTIKNLISNFN